MNLLILGAGGLMGRHLASILPAAGHTVVAQTHAGLDIAAPDAPRQAIETYRPDLVINAAGLVSFDACEADPARSRAVNLDAPLRWAHACAQHEIPFWAFSSDYIFDGTKRAPYLETDPPRPRSVYARHKAELEAGMAAFPDHLTLRVSWVYGLGGRTFMSLLPTLLATRDSLEVAAGKRGSCLYAADAARLIGLLLPLHPTGILNLVNTGSASWESFAQRCLHRMRAMGLATRCRSIRETPFETLSPSTTGLRPPYSVLDTARLQTLAGQVAPWEIAQDRFLVELAAAGELRREGRSREPR